VFFFFLEQKIAFIFFHMPDFTKSSSMKKILLNHSFYLFITQIWVRKGCFIF